MHKQFSPVISAGHSFHNHFSTLPLQTLPQALMSSPVTLLTPAQGILFPIKVNENLTYNLHHTLGTSNTQLLLITIPIIANIGRGENKVHCQCLLITVNLNHDQV